MLIGRLGESGYGCPVIPRHPGCRTFCQVAAVALQSDQIVEGVSVMQLGCIE